MSQYVKLLQHNGGFISVLADDDGIIQYTTNDADYAGIPAGASAITTAAPLSGDGTLGDPATIAAGAIPYTALASNDSITTLVAPAQDLDITGLAGDTDGDYEMWWSLIAVANAGNVVTLQPQQLATNQSGEALISAGGTPAGADLTDMRLGTNNDAGNDHTMVGHGYLTSKSGRTRFFQCVNNYTTSVNIQFNTTVQWTGTATIITNLRFHSSIAVGLGTGSFVRLRKMRNVT